MKAHCLMIFLLAVCFANAQDTLATFGANKCYYETDGSSKSLGVKIQLQRPCEWLPYMTQGMVQGFYFHATRDQHFMQYLIIDKLPKRLAKENIDTLFTEEGLKNLASELGYFFISGKQLKIDDMKAAEFVYKSTWKERKKTAFYYAAEYFLIYKSFVVKLTFKTKAPREADAASMFDTYKTFFQELGRSMVLMSK
jgi:hypothetical protein